jgi:prepilin-type processing-associated H-X9-DG protein
MGYQMSWIAQILPFIEEASVYRRLDFSVGAYHPKNAAPRRLSLPLLRCPSDASMGNFSGVGSYAGCHHDVEAPIDEDNHGVLFLNSRVQYRDILDGRAQTIALGEIVLKAGAELGWLSGSRSTLRNTGTPMNETTSSGGLLASMASAGVVRQEQAVPLEDLPERSPLPDSTARMPWMYTDEFQFNETAEYQPTGVAGNPALVVGGFESQHMSRGAQFAFADGSVRYLVDTIDFSVYQRLGHRADGQLIDDR